MKIMKFATSSKTFRSFFVRLRTEFGPPDKINKHLPSYTLYIRNPSPETYSLHYIRDPTYAQIELFSEMYFPRTSVSTAVRIWPKSKLKKWRPKREAKSRILRRSGGDRRSRETILKIAQSGHRLSLRLNMGDGRSGWWAPDLADGSFNILCGASMIVIVYIKHNHSVK